MSDTVFRSDLEFAKGLGNERCFCAPAGNGS